VLAECKLIDLPRIPDHRGNLSFIEGGRHIPFEIARVFYIYDVPGGESRGAHAHKENEQFIICLSGGMDVFLDDGYEKHIVRLNRAYQGLYIPKLIWASEGNFDTGTVYLVLASQMYSETDYYRDYNDFLQAVQR